MQHSTNFRPLTKEQFEGKTKKSRERLQLFEPHMYCFVFVFFFWFTSNVLFSQVQQTKTIQEVFVANTSVQTDTDKIKFLETLRKLTPTPVGIDSVGLPDSPPQIILFNDPTAHYIETRNVLLGNVRVLVAVWSDGTIVWSVDDFHDYGSTEYYKSQIDQERLKQFFAGFDQMEPWEFSGTSRMNLGSGFCVIFIVRDNKLFSLRVSHLNYPDDPRHDWHENANPALQKMIKVWRTSRDDILKLIPKAEGDTKKYLKNEELRVSLKFILPFFLEGTRRNAKEKLEGE